jgi:opacity protein-like surface antigen
MNRFPIVAALVAGLASPAFAADCDIAILNV